MNFFTGSPIVAAISDSSLDFTPADFDAPLGPEHQAYLQTQTGRAISQVFWRKQIHGDDILVASHSSKGCPDADAYITNQINLPIAIRTADCVPVFMYDPIQHAIGLVHAGWQGTHKQIAAKTLQQMQDKFGSKCYDLKVALGPSIRACCYQVGEEFKEYFPDDVKERDGHLYADVVNTNRRQLVKAGVEEANIIDSGVCTCCSPNYFSFRRDAQQSGRMISLMMLL